METTKAYAAAIAITLAVVLVVTIMAGLVNCDAAADNASGAVELVTALVNGLWAAAVILAGFGAVAVSHYTIERVENLLDS